MLSISVRLVFILAITGSLWLPAGSWAQNQLAQVPTGTVPGELAQVPPGQFAVTYANGELLIKAQNAPLSEVLRVVCAKIGAELDAQSEIREPVLGILGPGPAKAVLVSLLNDAHVNYAISSTAEDPNTLASVAVFSQPKDPNSRYQVAQEQAGQPQDNSETVAPVRSGVKQMMELLEAAKTELANGATFNIQSGDGSDGDAAAAGGAEKVDMAAVLQQIEAQLKAAGATEAAGSNPPQNQQQADASTSHTAKPDPNAELPVGRPRHRRHH